MKFEISKWLNISEGYLWFYEHLTPNWGIKFQIGFSIVVYAPGKVLKTDKSKLVILRRNSVYSVLCLSMCVKALCGLSPIITLADQQWPLSAGKHRTNVTNLRYDFSTSDNSIIEAKPNNCSDMIFGATGATGATGGRVKFFVSCVNF